VKRREGCRTRRSQRLSRVCGGMCDQQDPRYATQGAWPHQLSGPRRSDRDWIRCEARTPDCDWACATASKVRAVRLRSLRELRRDILRWLVTRSMSHPTRLRRFGQPSRSSPKGRAKDGWEAGRRAGHLASVGGWSPLLANSFKIFDLARFLLSSWRRCLPALAGSAGAMTLEMTLEARDFPYITWIIRHANSERT